MHGCYRLALVAGLLGVAGCGSSESPAPQAAATRDAAATKPDGLKPSQAVAKFLEAVRVGDDKTVAQFLTPTARQKTAERELVVAPPGSDTASFQVGEAEQVAADAAHVASSWTDLDENGQPHTDQIVWILRQEPEGWRIAGMGTKLFEDQPPLFLNFEDPDDMLRKQRLAEQEMMRRAGQPVGSPVEETPPLQAQQPAASPTRTR